MATTSHFEAIPSDKDSDTIAAFKVLIHPGSLVFDNLTTATLEWIAERGAIDEAQRRLLRECRAFLLRAERSAA